MLIEKLLLYSFDSLKRHVKKRAAILVFTLEMLTKIGYDYYGDLKKR